MSAHVLPPLTGSALFDPWRLRYRERIAVGAEPSPVRQPTPSELLLWEALQTSDRSWVAEHPTVHGYCLDFFCAELRLAVEVDGGSHWGPKAAAHDEWRDEVHARLGIRTKRFTAREVEADVSWVLGEVEELAAARAAELAGVPTETQPDIAVVAAELADDERLTVYPPAPPGWSASLPACVTVLPAQASRSGLRRLLERTST